MSASTCHAGQAVAEPSAVESDGRAGDEMPALPAIDPMDFDDVVAVAASRSRPSHVLGILRRHWHIPLALVMLGLAYLSLRGHLPTMDAVEDAVTSAHLIWIGVAVACEAVSLGMFARQQQALLIAVGVRMSNLRSLGLTYARSALAICMPAGSAVSAGFAFQQYRRGGASNDKAAAVTVLSGVLSALGITVLYVTGVLGLLIAEPSATAEEHPVLLGAVCAAVVVAAGAWVWHRVRLAARRTTGRPHGGYGGISVPAPRDSGPAKRRDRLQQFEWWRSIRQGIADTIRAWQSISTRAWSVAGAFAILNWLLDLVCLVAATRAFSLPVNIGTVAALYLGAQIVRQLPLTPGGIGLIETTLLTGLVSAGAAAGPATAAILAYRILSCWLIIPIGGLAYLGLRRPSKLPITEPAMAAKQA